MKVSFFNPVFYEGEASGGWPTPTSKYSPDAAKKTLHNAHAQFELADQVGFDWVSVAEHHYGPVGLTPNPTVFAGALTKTVKRAKIALLGSTIPILNPVRAAEEIAMLDNMTDGRVVAGMFRGTPNEYVTYNTNPTESRGRFEEALQLIQRAWTEPNPFGWAGRYYEYRSISIWPKPVQVPHPPIYMSGSSPESAEFAARNCISLGLAVTTLPLAAKAADHYRTQAQLAGWQPTPDNVLYRLGFHVAATDGQATADLEASMHRPQRISPIKLNTRLEQIVGETGYYGIDKARQRARALQDSDVEERVQLGQIVIGSPDTVLNQIMRIRDELKPGILDLHSAFQLEDATFRSIELFGREVRPRLANF